MMNGNSHKLIYWIAGAVFAPLVLAVFGNIMHTTVGNNSRIAVLEIEFAETQRQLRSIENKLDRLLEGARQ